MNRLWQIITFPVWGPVKLVLWFFKLIGKGISWLFNVLKKSILFIVSSLPTLLVFIGIGLAVMSDGEKEVLNIAILSIMAGIALGFISSEWKRIRRTSGSAGGHGYSSAIWNTLPTLLILAGLALVAFCEGKGDLAHVSIALLYAGLGLAFIQWLWKKIRRTHRTAVSVGASGVHTHPSGTGKAIKWIFTAPFKLIWLLIRLPFMPIVSLWKAMRGPRGTFLIKTTSLAFTFASVFFGLAFLKYVLVDHPRFSELIYGYNTYRDHTYLGMVVMDRNDRLLGVFGDKKRVYKPIKDIPDTLQYAFISAEDQRFYKHFGIDPVSVGSAILYNVKKILTGGKPRGGSTITQQVVKNYLLKAPPTENKIQKLSRKMTEFFAAFELEYKLEKKEILEIYLNEIYLGMGSYGVVAAAECYFNKSLYELTIDEMALLGGLPQLPTRNPHNKSGSAEKVNERRKSVKERRNYVIRRMEEDGYISSTEARVARNASINNVKFNPLNQDENTALGGYIIEELHRLGYTDEQIKGNGFKVYLTIDINAQRAAMTSLQYGVRQVQRRQGGNAPQAALVAIDSKGDIIAMVGGLSYYDEKGDKRKNELNRTLSLRQPASTMKPIVYAAALDSGAISPDDTLDASPLVIGGRTISDRCDSQSSITDAIAQSCNGAVIRVYQRTVWNQRTGWNPVLNLVRQMGVETPMQDSPLLPLGVSETRLLDMTNAYTPFFNQGLMRRKPRIIFKVRDEQENWHEHGSGWPSQVISRSTANLIRRGLRSTVVSEKGTGRAAGSITGAAGKTGTTTANRDALFIGAAESRLFGTTVVGVWVGFDDNTRLGSGSTESGGRTSAPIWAKFFERIQK